MDLLGKENIIEIVRKVSITCSENLSVLEVGLLFLLNICSSNYNVVKITATDIFHESIIKKCSSYLQKFIDSRTSIDCELLKKHESLMFDSINPAENTRKPQRESSDSDDT